MSDALSIVAGVSSIIAVIASMIPIVLRYVFGRLTSKRLEKIKMEVHEAELINTLENLPISIKSEGNLEKDELLRRAIDRLESELKIFGKKNGSIHIRIVDQDGKEWSSRLEVDEGGQQ